MVDLSPYLEDLEEQIDPAVEEALVAEWVDFNDGRFGGDIFSPQRRRQRPGRVEWPRVSTNDTLTDFDAMALQQLGWCAGRLAAGVGIPLNVRCNYGTPIVPTLFGAELFVMDEAADTLPACRPIGPQATKDLLDRGIPDLDGGLCGRVFEMGERFAAIGRTYPKIGRHVFVYHPDFQGPMDICEMLWGSGIFFALVDEGDTVHQVLRLLTETYIALMRRWEAVTRQDGLTHTGHWQVWQKGRVMLRDDSAMNLSPEMYDEFIRPYNQIILDAFDGGAIHSCGRVDHFVDRLPGIRGLSGFNLTQPGYNDMEKVFRHTVDEGICLLELSRDAAEAALATGRDLKGRVHCPRRS